MRTILALSLLCMAAACGGAVQIPGADPYRHETFDVASGLQVTFHVPRYYQEEIIAGNPEYVHPTTGDRVVLDARPLDGPGSVHDGGPVATRSVQLGRGSPRFTTEFPGNWQQIYSVENDRLNCAAYRDPVSGYTMAFHVVKGRDGTVISTVHGRSTADALPACQ